MTNEKCEHHPEVFLVPEIEDHGDSKRATIDWHCPVCVDIRMLVACTECVYRNTKECVKRKGWLNPDWTWCDMGLRKGEQPNG